MEYVEQARGRCLVLDQSCLSVRLHPYISVWGHKIYIYRFINKNGEWMEQEVCARMSAWYAGTTQTLFIVPKQQLMVIM